MNNQKIKNIELVNKKLTCDEIHWWQFPLNDLSVKFSDTFKTEFFHKIYTERSKSLDFAKYVNEKSEKYNKNWNFKRQRVLLWDYKANAEFVPAWFVYESARYLKLDLLEIEKNMVAYMTFRGRTIIFKEQGEILLLKLAQALEEYGVVENMPKLEGKRMIMLIAPIKKK